MKRLRVGVVGCGWVARNYHIPNYIKNAKSEIVALCDVNEEPLIDIAKKYGIKHTFTNYHDLFEKDIIDAVSICTPTSSHCEIAIEAANHGINVLCEKPLALSIEEANKIIDSISHNEVKFMVGFNYRFLSNHRKMKEYLSSGKIGKPIFIKGEIVVAGPYRNEIPEKNITHEAEKRIGALFDLGSHMADLFIWIMGKPIEVNAFLSTYREGVYFDDSSVVSIKFESGVIGNIIALWLNMKDYHAVANNRTIEIIGERGKIESDFFGPSLYFYSNDSLTSRIKGKVKITPRKFNPKIPDQALAWSYGQEIESFLDSIIKDKDPPVSAEEAREALRLILAAYESGKTKSLIKLE